MPLDNYANLKQQVVSWSHRDDIQQHVSDCIELCESHMYRGTSGLRVKEMELELIGAYAGKTIALEAGTLEFRNLSIEVDGVYYRLKKIPLAKIPDDGSAGQPTSYALTDQIVLDVDPDKTYNFKIEYYGLPTPLSDSEPTNLILETYPNIYFYGSMSAAFQYAGELDQVTYYGNLFQSEILRANEDSQMFGMGTLPTQHIDGCIP
jgi:hypothetical protein